MVRVLIKVKFESQELSLFCLQLGLVVVSSPWTLVMGSVWWANYIFLIYLFCINPGWLSDN